MNKFEALAQFQAWPPEWQRLCAEYWIETGEVDPKFVLAFPKQAAGDLRYRGAIPSDCIDQGEMKLGPMPKAAAKMAAVALPMPGDLFPYDQTREIRRAARAKNMNPLKPWSIADDETLVKLHDTGIRRSEIIMRFMADHPYRTFNAVASRHDHLRRLDWKVQ